MSNHNETKHAAEAEGCQPNGVRGGKLGIPQIEAAKPFSANTTTSNFAVDSPCKNGADFASEMLKIMLADCRSELGKTREELRQIEPVREMLSEKESRLKILEAGIFEIMRRSSPLFAEECAGMSVTELGGETHEVATKSSVTVLLMARARAFPCRD